VPRLHTRTGRQGIALCLSGGGFRAALFHLGALRRLFEVGAFNKLRTISSVSGGSILAGHIANVLIERREQGVPGIQDWEQDVAAGFRRIAGRDLRTGPMLAHLLWNWALPGFRVRHLQRRYRRRVTARMLGELPEQPAFVFCATDLVYGVNWEFQRDRVGDYLAGYTTECDDWPLAQAIAASACFPPLFGPLPLRLPPGKLNGGKYAGSNHAALNQKLGLTDGGVYDNMALEPVWKSHECVLVSDCGGPFECEVTGNYVGRLLRYTSIVMNQAQAMRKRAYFQAINSQQLDLLYRGGYWGLGGNVTTYLGSTDLQMAGYSKDVVDEVITRVRTDLDRFTHAEMCVLENHGYLLASAVLAHYRPDLIDASAPPATPPHPEWMNEVRVRVALRASHARFSLTRLLGAESP
jgi:NTE family protein